LSCPSLLIQQALSNSDKVGNLYFKHLDELREKLSLVLSELTPSIIASVTEWDFILELYL